MSLIYHPELISFLSNKHLLLDTNVFIDASSKPTTFDKFFNRLKENDVTLVTIDFVKYELLKGSRDETKYKEKEELLESIIDTTLLAMPKTYQLTYELIKSYGIEGTSLDVTDLILGTQLIQYKPNLCLMTRDTSDFIQNIFDLPYIINLPHGKGILTYGVYQYTK